MNTPTIQRSHSNRPAVDPKRPPVVRRGGWLAVAAAAAVVASGGAFYSLGNDPEVAQAPLELSIGANDVMASCLPLQADILASMSPAFAATTTAVDGETITLVVDHWFAGGDADTVVLHSQSGMESLIAGFDFEVGQEYLITASEGTVNFCGYSGLATPELAAVFAEAFPG